MKAPSEQNTFRRRAIADKEPERKSQAAAEENNNTLAAIHNNLQNNQAATELTSEVIEAKGNQILYGLGEINDSIKDVEAATELTAEAAEKTNTALSKFADVNSAISDKLSKLISNFEGKLGSNLPAPVEPVQTTEEAIQDSMPVAIVQPQFDELMNKLLPGTQPTSPENPLPTVPDEQNGKNDKDAGFDLSDKMDTLIGLTKGGFKSSLAVTDRIAGMLFQYTVTAALQAAKMAAMILGVIMALDVLQVSFKYWSELFSTKFEEFYKTTKAFGPLIASVLEMAEEIKHFWDESNWTGLIVAFGKGMANMTIELANLLFLGIAKLTAAIVRAIPGMSDTADNIEGAALQKFQEDSGASLSKEDQQTLAKYQIRNEDEEFEAKNKEFKRYKDNPKALEYAVKNGSVSQETADEINSGKMKDPSVVKEEDRIASKTAENEARASLKRTKELADKTREGDSMRGDRLKKSLEDISGYLKDPKISPEAKKELDVQYKELSTTIDKKLKPVQVNPEKTEEKDESKIAGSVEQAQQRKEAPQVTQQPTANINTVNTKVNKAIYNQSPVTSTPSPGMHLSTRVS